MNYLWGGMILVGVVYAAIRKSALALVFLKFRKTTCKLVLENNIISVGIK